MLMRYCSGRLIDVEKAALEVKDYKGSVSLASQTALRDVIGKTILSDMLTGREAIDAELQRLIGNRVSGWGIKVISVEIRDVVIPGALPGRDVHAGAGRT